MRLNRVRQRLASGGCAFGPNLQAPSTWLVEMIGLAGFDFVMLDGEHGAAFSNLPNLILAADAAGVIPVVRVSSHERGFILQALELGAGGVQAPMVNTVEEAKKLVWETKYAPLGGRGFSNATRAANYGAIRAEDLGAAVNPEVLCIVQLETREALRHAADIAQLPGVDLVFIGPADLAQSLGFPGQTDAPEVINVMKKLVHDLRPHVAVGMSAFSAEEVRFWRNEGVQSFLTTSTHTVRRAFEALYSELTAGLSPDAPGTNVKAD